MSGCLSCCEQLKDGITLAHSFRGNNLWAADSIALGLRRAGIAWRQECVWKRLLPSWWPGSREGEEGRRDKIQPPEHTPNDLLPSNMPHINLPIVLSKYGSINGSIHWLGQIISGWLDLAAGDQACTTWVLQGIFHVETVTFIFIKILVITEILLCRKENSILCITLKSPGVWDPICLFDSHLPTSHSYIREPRKD
jgi:hypothetical protein